MGKGWSRKRKSEIKEDRKDAQRPRKEWTPVFQGNKKMEAYYALQGLHNFYLADGTEFKECVSDEEKEKERMRWMDKLKTILPASFRIGDNVDKTLRDNIEKELEEFVGTEMEIVIDPSEGRRDASTKVDDTELVTKKIAPARRIPFIPHGYQLSLDRRTIRRNAGLGKFHDWLKVQTSAGFVTRQETVSMIPPVILDIEPHHVVLDMCAAPGSKTSQILELVSLCAQEGDLEPRGCVVANDSDPKRAYMLVHQLRRINSPSVFVTSCDAQFFPLLKSREEKERGEEGAFDRVLCDVPCSGDGTTRKNPGIWKQWNQLGALALHPLQLAIALNGARLTKVGGYICYSTCSLNPVENEAVVAEILRAADGSLELVDKRKDMPGLLARPGWTTWRVLKEERSKKEQKRHRKKHNEKMKARRQAWEEEQKKKEEEGAKDEMKGEDEKKPTEQDDTKPSEKAEPTGENGVDDGPFTRTDFGPPPSWDEKTLQERAKAVGLIEYKSFEDVPPEFRRRVRASCFPPTEEEVQKFGLEKCLRCLPHDMDTGGFFVALLKKVAPMSPTARERALKLARELRTDVVDDEGTGAAVASNKAASETKSTDDNAVDSVETESNISSNIDSGKQEEEESKEEMNSEKDDGKSTSNGTEPQKIVKGKPLLRGRGKTRGDLGNENFVPLNDDIWAQHVEFYGLSSTFPREQMMGRSSGNAKVLYFIANSIKTKFMDRGIQDRVTVVNSGLKAFERNNKDCEVRYRVAQEGIHFIAPHMTKRKVLANQDDFSKCLNTGGIRLDELSDELAGAIRPISTGSFVVALKGFEHDVFKKMFLVMWRCRGDAVNCLVAKVEMDGMKSKLRAIQEESEKATSKEV